MKNKKWIIIGGIVLVIIVGVVVFFLMNQNQNKDDSEDSKFQTQETPDPATDKNIPVIDKKTKDTTESMVDSSINTNDLAKQMDTELTIFDAYLSSDSFLRSQVKQKNKNQVQGYEEAQTRYASRVEEYIRNNTSYTFGTPLFSESNYVQTVTVKPYYYQLYEMHLTEIMDQLLEMSGFDLTRIEENDEWEVAFYKAKVKAMEILDSNLDYYVATDSDIVNVDLIYVKKGNEYVCEDYIGLLNALKGGYSPKFEFANDQEATAFANEIETYCTNLVNQAQSSGKIQTSNPLALQS